MTWKQTVMRGLPRPIVHWFRKQYYPGVVRRFDESRWPCASVVKKLLRPGDVVIDAGANIGYISYMLAKWVGPDGEVHALEPVPGTFDLLRHNVGCLNCPQLTLYNVAASSESGQALMEIPEYEGGGENLYESRVVDAEDEGKVGLRTATVELKTLDELFLGSERPVACIKVDVEGHELDAIRGAAGLLQKWKPSLIIEVSGDPQEQGSKAEQLFGLLETSGYAPYVLVDEGLKPREAGHVSVDYFFLQPEHVELCV